ncbi:MAG: amino-acid N-acetyltransferase [Candidatus Protistobacter heckmanni]|nr:amino-acid N-acetyltransferase [Candidatus Protistobacter heckmanni]
MNKVPPDIRSLAETEKAAESSSDPAPEPPAAPALSQHQFVDWLREVAPYIHAFHGQTFVIGFGGELVKAGGLNALVQDVAMLHAMGMRIVLVHGSRPQVQEQLALRKVESRYGKGRMQGMRITDEAALECAKEASGELRLDIEAAFSQGLPNTPMAGARISVVSGNFVTARPVGVVDGVDFHSTGLVRKIDETSISLSLQSNKIVLLSPLGFSPTGQAFNLALEDVATRAAVALKADKLIFISEVPGVLTAESQLIPELSLTMTENVLRGLDVKQPVQAMTADYLNHAIKALRGGVPRIHLIPFALDGSLLLELFSHDGVGTMMSRTDLEHLREASVDDVGGILQLIEPLEQDGTLVPRGRQAIERDIANFSVIEHDRVIFGCAALYPYQEEKIGELACLAVDPEAQGEGDGEWLLKRIEQRAREQGLQRIFVLTTRTEHWFLKRGFVRAEVSDLPAQRQQHYNAKRRSMVLIKKL